MQFGKGLLNNRQEADQIYLYDSDSFEKSMAPELNGSYSEHSSNQNELQSRQMTRSIAQIMGLSSTKTRAFSVGFNILLNNDSTIS